MWTYLSCLHLKLAKEEGLSTETKQVWHHNKGLLVICCNIVKNPWPRLHLEHQRCRHRHIIRETFQEFRLGFLDPDLHLYSQWSRKKDICVLFLLVKACGNVRVEWHDHFRSWSQCKSSKPSAVLKFPLRCPSWCTGYNRNDKERRKYQISKFLKLE